MYESDNEMPRRYRLALMALSAGGAFLVLSGGLVIVAAVMAATMGGPL